MGSKVNELLNRRWDERRDGGADGESWQDGSDRRRQ